ncbi:hypothetical protein JCM6882_008895 [Rhodosporidiobolus microsporus]
MDEIPLESIPRIIPFATFLTYIAPSCGLKLGDLFAPFLTRPGPPQWTAWLEAWYQTYEPTAWQLLGEDDERDVRLMQELDTYCDARRRERHDEDEDEELKWAIRTFQGIVAGRHHRHLQIYSLHVARQAYIRHHQALKQGATESDILSCLEGNDASLFPAEAAGSVWPLYSAHPNDRWPFRSCPCKMHFSRSLPAAYERRYGLPDATTAEIKRLASEVFGPRWRRTQFEGLLQKEAMSPPRSWLETRLHRSAVAFAEW